MPGRANLMSPEQMYNMAPSRFGVPLKVLTNKKALDVAIMKHQWEMQKNAQELAAGQKRQETAGRFGLQEQAMSLGQGRLNEQGSFEPVSSPSGGTTPGVNTENISDVLSSSGVPQEEHDDYRVVPQTYTYRGNVKTINKLERKKDLPNTTTEKLNDLEATVYQLNENKNLLQQKNIQSGPGIVTRGGAVGDILGQYLRGPEFVSWKSSVGDAFQKYRKWATGVQAGYPELQLLAPNFPKTTDKPDVFNAKTDRTIKTIEANKKRFLDYLSRSGFAVSAYRNGMAQSEQQAPQQEDFSQMSDDELRRIANGG